MLEAGGLFILGTERHESRRIDNQLRGRAGRQGDPGESRFFLSAQDDLVRLFAGERIYKILDRLGSVDEEGNEEPIEAGMLSKQIEKAQKKVEEQHFLMRKHTLEYDDVLNQQREVIYTYRDEVLEGRDMSEAAREEIVNLIERLVDEYTAGEFVEDWDVEGLMRRIEEIFTPSDELAAIDPTRLDREDLVLRLQEEALARYDEREQELGEELMRHVERFLLLQIIDQRWQEHLYDMDYLQQGIHLRGFAQIEPLVAYKNEAFELFRDLMNSDLGRLRAADLPRRGHHPRGGWLRFTASQQSHQPRPHLTHRRWPGQLLRRLVVAAQRAGHGRRGGLPEGYVDAAIGGRRAAARGRAAPGRRDRADRPQRPLLVRVGQEVQEVPRRVAG